MSHLKVTVCDWPGCDEHNMYVKSVDWFMLELPKFGTKLTWDLCLEHRRIAEMFLARAKYLEGPEAPMSDNCVFLSKNGWQLCYKNIVPATTWQNRGAAAAQLDLLEREIDILLPSGTIKHGTDGRNRFSI
jgi:hypothetical protein